MKPTATVGTITTPPDDQGWQVTYDVGVQDKELVITGLAIQSLIGITAGGLTAERARSLLKTGKALREFAKNVVRDRVMPELSDPEVDALMQGKESWRAEPTAAFAAHLRVLQALPEISQFLRGKRLSRRERVAQTAALYVAAIGDPAPLQRVARQQRRTRDQVRDDLHAARTEMGFLSAGSRGRAGGTLTSAAEELLQQSASELRGTKPSPRTKARAAKARNAGKR